MLSNFLPLTEPVLPQGRSRPQILVALPVAARPAVMPSHEHQVATGHLWRPDHRREDTRASALIAVIEDIVRSRVNLERLVDLIRGRGRSWPQSRLSRPALLTSVRTFGSTRSGPPADLDDDGFRRRSARTSVRPIDILNALSGFCSSAAAQSRPARFSR
jgi:hypothetical protein